MGIIYKTTNLINNKWYIGKDEKNNPRYLGSGVLLARAIKKYGKEHFKKEVIAECNDGRSALADLEKKIIAETNAVADDMAYNIAEGGLGGIASDKFIKARDTGRRNWWKSLSADEKFKYQSDRATGWWNKLTEQEKEEESRRRANNASRYYLTLTEEDIKRRTLNHRDKISRTCKIISPSGEIIITNRLRETAKEIKVSYNSLNLSIKEKRPVKGGWICEVMETTPWL